MSNTPDIFKIGQKVLTNIFEDKEERVVIGTTTPEACGFLGNVKAFLFGKESVDSARAYSKGAAAGEILYKVAGAEDYARNGKKADFRALRAADLRPFG